MSEELEKALAWLKERVEKLGRRARLGDLADIDLEEEFDEAWKED